MLFWDLLGGGVAIGCVYSLIALGFTMIIRATGIIHFAQGEVMMLGSMSGITVLAFFPQMPAIMVLILGMLASGIIAVGMELFVYRTLRVRRIPIMNIITATVGMSILFMNAARIIWGSEPLRYPDIFGTESFIFSGIPVSPQLV